MSKKASPASILGRVWCDVSSRTSLAVATLGKPPQASGYNRSGLEFGGLGVEPAWEARVAAAKAACKADMLLTELARASPTAQAAKEAVRKARREAGGSDLEVRQ